MNVYSQCKDTIIFLNQEKKHKELFTSLSCNTNDIERYPEARFALCFAQQGISMLNRLLK